MNTFERIPKGWEQYYRWGNTVAEIAAVDLLELFGVDRIEA